MPFLRVSTSAPLSDRTKQGDVLDAATRLVAEHLGKPIDYVMVCLDHDVPMLFAGSAEPCACVEIRTIGKPTAPQAEGLTSALTDALAGTLGISKRRVFVVFEAVPAELWGVGGSMLG